MNSDALILCIKSNHALHKSIDGFLFNLTPPFLNELNFAPAFTITWFVEINFAIVTSLSTILKYVLSTMGVSKESISKFLIGNRFHVKLRIPSPFSNRISRWQSTDSSKAYRNTSTFKCLLTYSLRFCLSWSFVSTLYYVETWVTKILMRAILNNHEGCIWPADRRFPNPCFRILNVRVGFVVWISVPNLSFCGAKKFYLTRKCITQ